MATAYGPPRHHRIAKIRSCATRFCSQRLPQIEPVSIIQGAAENLEDGALEDENMARRFTATILRNSQRLSLLISDLELSQLDSGTTQLKQVPVGLYTLAESICEDLKERAVTKQVQILLDVSPEHQVMADPNGMEQVFKSH